MQEHANARSIHTSSTQPPQTGVMQRSFKAEGPSKIEARGEQPDLQTQLEIAKRFGHHFAKVSVFAPGTEPPPPPSIQPKLTIVQHRTDEFVPWAAPQPLLQPPNTPSLESVTETSNQVVQTKCSKCGADEQAQTEASQSPTTLNGFINSLTSQPDTKQGSNANAAPPLLAMNPRGQCIQLDDLPGWRQRAREAQRRGGNTLDQFCYELVQLIRDCHGDIHKRLEDMLNDRRTGQNLYQTRRYMRDHPEGNTWEGHQLRYNNTRTITRELIDFWYDNCGGGDGDSAYFLAYIEDANIAANTPAPDEPLSANNQRLLERAQQLGARFIDGALWVGKGVAKGAFVILVIIAKALAIPLYQEGF